MVRLRSPTVGKLKVTLSRRCVFSPTTANLLTAILLFIFASLKTQISEITSLVILQPVPVDSIGIQPIFKGV